MHHALINTYYYAQPSSGGGQELFVSSDGSGVGTQADPFGPSEFETALAAVDEPTTFYFKRGDTFNDD